MLQLVTGTMRGGKSYYCVEQAWNAWKRGSIVHDNFVWTEKAQRFAKLHVILPADPAKWARRNPETGKLESDVIVRGTEACPNIVLIDEAYLYLGLHDRLKHQERNRFLLEFFAMSGQLGLQVFFISQSAENVDAGVRKIAAFHMHCVNNSKIPGLGAIAGRLLGRFTRIAKSPEKGIELSRSSANLVPEIAELYSTTGQGDEINAATHVGTGTVTVATAGRFKVWGVVIAGCLCFAGWYYFRPPPASAVVALSGAAKAPAVVSGGMSAGPVARSVVSWAQFPVLTLVLDDGSTLSMSAPDFPLQSARRLETGFAVVDASGKETFYPFKK